MEIVMLSNRNFILFSFLILAPQIGCQKSTEPDAEADVPAISVDVVEEQTEPTDNTSAETGPVIIDVRSLEEWNSGHLGQAIHIPHDEIVAKIAEHVSDKSTPIVLHCRAGGRAGRAKTALEDLGYTDVENVGGLEDAQQRFGGE